MTATHSGVRHDWHGRPQHLRFRRRGGHAVRLDPRGQWEAAVNAAAQATRRRELRSRGLCITAASHGPATHGVLCEKCRLQHRGTPAPLPQERISLASRYPATRELSREPAPIYGPPRRRGPKPKSAVTLAAPTARIGLCAICTNVGHVMKTQLDPGGPLYDVCARCNDEAPRERDHLFGSQPSREGATRATYGIGDGNRRASGKGNRQ